ncbi:MAG: hypothetical protein V4494_03175 [Chlamydiota bacterium]
MSDGSVNVTLRDGSKIHVILFFETTKRIVKLSKTRPDILTELVKKCKDSGYQFSEKLRVEAREILLGYTLIDASEKAYTVTRKIVLNSLRENGLREEWINPLRPERISEEV